MRQHYLVFAPDSEEVFLVEDDFPSASNVVPFPYRISPIFPVLPDEFEIPVLTGTSFLGFFAFDRAFSAIGQFLRKLPPDLLPRLWFSHGYASLLIFAPARQDIENICNEPEALLRGQEVWTLKDGHVVEREFNLAPPSSVSLESLSVFDYSALDVDLQKILLEFKHCVYTAVERSARYAPDYLGSFFKLIETVNHVIGEILYITGHSGERPDSLSEAFGRRLREDGVVRQRRINQRADQIIQLNSALSYVISQAFAGTIPILERECQIQSHSLLGVSVSVLALFRFSDFVQSVFRAHPIDSAIANKYSLLEGVGIQLSLRDSPPQDWNHEDMQIDTHLRGIEPASLRPKLVFYSGRLGFKESEFSVTVALQVLFGADSARWSLMTLTHELMHAHIRSLLAVILREFDEDSPDHWFTRAYGDLRAFHKREKRRWKLVQSIRSIVLNYILQKRSYDHAARGLKEGRPPRVDVTLPPREDLLRWIREDFRDLNEIMVHVCDYHYFYNASDELYLGLLWESWATVPGVLSEIDHYVFRSLVAVATKEAGSTLERFQLAVNILIQSLEAILSRRPGNPVVGAALDFLRNGHNHLPLEIRFVPALYLADATLKLLVSRRIHAELIGGDENVEVVGGGYIYQVETGEFPGFDIVSPVGFLADRLRRALAGEVAPLSEEYASAWVLLACASTRSRA